MNIMKREKREKIFKEIMAKNFTNLLKNYSLHIQKGQHTPSRNTEIHRHTLLKMLTKRKS